MGVVTAKAAGVNDVVVATAPHPVILAAARLCEADAVYAVTGAQAVAALAYGTRTIPRADVIVGGCCALVAIMRSMTGGGR